MAASARWTNGKDNVRRSAIVAAVALAVCLSACDDGPTAPTGPLFTIAGTGDQAFTVPSGVTRARITGTYNGNSSNFVLWIGPPASNCELQVITGCRLVVNELLGTGWNRVTIDGLFVTGGGGRAVVEDSAGVAWTFTEVR